MAGFCGRTQESIHQEASQMIPKTGGPQATFWEHVNNTVEGTDPFMSMIPNKNCYHPLGIFIKYRK